MKNLEYYKKDRESLFTRLLWANLHYDGDSSKAMDRCAKLLDEVLNDTELSDLYKKTFLDLWKDQASKLYESHGNYEKGLKMKFDMSLENKPF